MNIQAPVSRHVQHRFRQNQPVCGNNHYIGIKKRDCLLCFGGLQGYGLHYRDIMLKCQLLYRTCRQVHTTAGRTVGLRKYCYNLVFAHQGSQGACRKFWRSCEYDLHVGPVLEGFALLLLQFRANTSLFKVRQVLNEYAPQQVIDFMLDTYGQQTVSFKRERHTILV